MSAHHLQHLSWPEIERLARPDAIGLIPLAAVEQHGPHLPTRTDAAIAEHLADMIGRRCPRPVLIVPVLPGGVSRHHSVLPGTIDLPESVFIGWLQAVLAMFDRLAVSQVAVFSSHGGNFAPLERALPGVESACRVAAFTDKDAYFEAMRSGARTAGFTDYSDLDRHAGGLETSQILHIAGEAAVGQYLVVEGLDEPLDGWYERMHADGVTAVSPNGVLGRPAAATEVMGAAIMRSLTEALTAFIDAELPLPGRDAHANDGPALLHAT